MAGIFERLGNILSANINAMLDKAEDPAKMVDEYLRDAREDLAEVRKNTAGVIAEESRCRRLVEKNRKEAEDLYAYADKAVAAGNDEDAARFLAERQKALARAEEAEKTYAAAKQHADMMRQAHDKLTADIEELESRKANIKATAAVAKTQKTINAMTNKAVGSSNALAAFDRMADKAQAELDMAKAEAELGSGTVEDMDDLKEKYTGVGSQAVADELAALKARHAGGN